MLLPAADSQIVIAGGIRDSIAVLAAILLIFAALVVVHELIHGLFFWRFTGERPTFGFLRLMAYAAAPGFYIPRNQYIVVGIAPLAVITATGLAAIPFLPSPESLGLLSFVMALNAGGSIGDLIIIAWFLRYPHDAVICDAGSAIHVYRGPHEVLKGGPKREKPLIVRPPAEG